MHAWVPGQTSEKLGTQTLCHSAWSSRRLIHEDNPPFVDFPRNVQT